MSTETQAMRQAITLSAIGLGSTSPNPPVGCVILSPEGKLVGHGYHQRYGDAHAEAHALAAAGDAAAGSTAIVTLEPCNHRGRTPPCHQALLDAGIARVVVAVIDPTSRGEGGIARLRAEGIDVEVGLLEPEAMVMLEPWLTALRLCRPFMKWEFAIDTETSSSLPHTFQAADVRVTSDKRVTPVRESIIGPQGTSWAALALSDNPDNVVTQLYEAGIRSALLHGNSALARSCLHAGLVDEVRVTVPCRVPTSAPSLQEFLPDGFTITAASANSENTVAIHAKRTAGIPLPNTDPPTA